VQALPSLHVVPLAAIGFEQAPVDVLHVPAVWHWSEAVQFTGFEPTQAPDWQVSLWVQALPSLHAVPLFAVGFEHAPVDGLHVPATWHWSDAAHVTEFEPTQMPAWHESVWVQAFPSLHAVPLLAIGFEQAPVDGLQMPAT
jgi:hypothetical protein